MKYRYILLMLSLPMSPLLGMADINKNITLLQEQIKTIEATGNRLLSTGKQLNDELIKKIDTNQKDVAVAMKALKLPVDILTQPIKTLQTVADKEIGVDILKKPILVLLNNPIIQNSLTIILQSFLKVIHFQKLPELMTHLNTVLNTVNSTMVNVHRQFYPFVLELHSFVDINQAIQDLHLSSGTYTAVTLEFIEKYPEYVKKVYAQHTNGGIFDQKGIYNKLLITKKHFERAVVHLQKLQELLRSFGG